MVNDMPSSPSAGVARLTMEAELTMEGMDESYSFEETGTNLTDALYRCRVSALRSAEFDTEDIREIQVVRGSFER